MSQRKLMGMRMRVSHSIICIMGNARCATPAYYDIFHVPKELGSGMPVLLLGQTTLLTNRGPLRKLNMHGLKNMQLPNEATNSRIGAGRWSLRCVTQLDKILLQCLQCEQGEGVPCLCRGRVNVHNLLHAFIALLHNISIDLEQR